MPKLSDSSISNISSLNVQSGDFIHWVSSYSGTPTSYKITFSELVSKLGTTLPFIGSIENLITQGTNVTITGSGTEADPYIINSTGGGAADFLSLTDTPVSYSGQAGKAVFVNGTATGLVFADVITSVSWGGIGGTLADQIDLQAALDAKVDENTPITGATKTKITYDTKGLVTGGADATTADIADSTNKRYVTDAQLVVIGDTSGVNTGDQDLSGYMQSVVAGENIAVNNTNPQNPLIASSGQSDPNGTIIGTGVSGDEFKYNEVVVTQSGNLTLTDDDKYKIFTTDGSNNYSVDFSGVSEEFTCRFVVSPRNPATIQLLSSSMYIGTNEYTSDLNSSAPSSALTVRVLAGRISCESVSGLWWGV